MAIRQPKGPTMIDSRVLAPILPPRPRLRPSAIPARAITSSLPAVAPAGADATRTLGMAAADLTAALGLVVTAASPREAVAAAEAVSTYRRNMYLRLIDLGWEPPHGVVDGMVLDLRLTHEGIGACYDNPAEWMKPTYDEPLQPPAPNRSIPATAVPTYWIAADPNPHATRQPVDLPARPLGGNALPGDGHAVPASASDRALCGQGIPPLLHFPELDFEAAAAAILVCPLCRAAIGTARLEPVLAEPLHIPATRSPVAVAS
jgi:hypothetical protein